MTSSVFPRPSLRLVGALLPLLTACSSHTPPESAPAPAPGQAPASTAEVVKAVMDPTADPCQDFYRYACGGWLDTTEIPADKSSWGRGFDLIWEHNREVMRQIVEDDAKGGVTDPAHQQLVDYYASCKDTETIERRGAEPLRPLMEKIDAIKDPASLMATMAELHAVDVDALFGIWVGADFKAPTQNLLAVFQGGLGLPDRDYYLVDDPGMAGLRDAYKAHMTEMLTLLYGAEAQAAAEATAILALETEIARISLPREEMRDPQKLYHKLPRAEFAALTPHLDWSAYLAPFGADAVAEINAASPEYLKALDALVTQTDPATLKMYLRWRLLTGNANLLSSTFDETNFAFFGKMLRGQPEQQERGKRCVAGAGFALGDTMSRLFIAREFSGDSKDVSQEMIKRIEDAFAGMLPGISWMDDETRARALEKMTAIRNKIGYPDKWEDYSSIPVKPDTYFENVLATRRYASMDTLAKLGKPVDPDEWMMPAFLVNAYYNPSNNEIVFPAGILQAPFFDRDFPAAMNFGGIGMVMGHELTHGFDDQGRKFDAKGSMSEWWAPEVSARFETAAQCVSDLYSGYSVKDGLNVNGQLTLGENIADLGGIKQAYGAWKGYVKDHGTGGSIEGLTDDQLFFVAFAQSWCTQTRPEMEEVLVRTDPHSPAQFRVNGPLSNFPAFGEAFSCQEGTPMRPAQRCEVW